MASSNRINIDVLRKTINGVFDFITQDLGIEEVELKNNFYWSIPDDALYTMDRDPKEIDVGSLYDDWEFVLSALQSDQHIPIEFIHVAPLLYALAYAVPSYK